MLYDYKNTFIVYIDHSFHYILSMRMSLLVFLFVHMLTNLAIQVYTDVTIILTCIIFLNELELVTGSEPWFKVIKLADDRYGLLRHAGQTQFRSQH